MFDLNLILLFEKFYFLLFFFLDLVYHVGKVVIYLRAQNYLESAYC